MSKPVNNNAASMPNPVFTRLTPEMSREQQIENLKAALIKSGFTITEKQQ